MSFIRFSKLRTSSLAKKHMDMQKRHILPLIVGGIAIFALGTAGRYVVRALKRMEEDPDGNSNNNNDDGESKPAPQGNSSPQIQLRALGIDIGSTFSRVALRNDMNISILENSEGQRSVPCAVMTSGELDIDAPTGMIARNNRYMKSGKVLYGGHMLIGLQENDDITRKISEHLPEFKVAMQDSNIGFDVSGTHFSSNFLYKLYLKKTFEISKQKDSTLDNNISTTITVPNYFTKNQISNVLKTSHESGLKNVNVITDNISAIIGAYHLKSINELLGNYFIIDFGGRSVQLSLIQMNNNNKFNIITSSTYFDMGGEFIDNLIAKHIANEFEIKHKFNIINDNMSKQRLIDACENAKIELSSKTSTSISLPFITANQKGPLHLQHDMNRATLESLMSPMMIKLQDAIKQLSNDVELKALNIDITKIPCLVIGGGARMNSIVKAVSNVCPNQVKLSEPEEVVCIGAAAYSSHNLK
jgi:molecular chaperone DnaK